MAKKSDGSTHNGAGVPLDRVRPFYQVVVFVDPRKQTLELKAELTKSARPRRQRDSAFAVKGAETDDMLQYVHVEHTMPPSWVRGPSPFKDVEHDEAILYRTGDYVFLHSNCSTLLDLLTTAFAEKLDRVRAADIEKVLVQRGVEIRSLGMQNLNAPGKTAPEGKIHFARNAAYTLSPVRDAMFGFRHAFAVERGDAGAKSKPFGCSTRKRKVWGTWCEDAAAFVAECDRLAKDLAAPDSGKRSWVLAAPVPAPPADAEPIAFYADYSIERKGMVWIEADNGDFSADWTCYLSPAGAAQFEVSAPRGAAAKFNLRIDRDDRKVFVAYPDGASSRKAKISDDGGALEHRRSRDLVELLNDEEAFTVVFGQGISYRMGEFWKNTGLGEVFSKARTDMSWRGINIRKESLVKGATDTIGDAIIRFLDAERWPEVVICDDGSNEIADFLAAGKGRVALIHAKYSSEPKTGLRAEDVQVVIAQCLKNLQYFQWTALEPYLPRLKNKVVRKARSVKSVEAFLQSTWEHQRTLRECWIVQPGISSNLLAKDPDNKIQDTFAPEPRRVLVLTEQRGVPFLLQCLNGTTALPSRLLTFYPAGPCAQFVSHCCHQSLQHAS